MRRKDNGDPDVEVVEMTEDELGELVDKRVQAQLKRQRPSLVGQLGAPTGSFEEGSAERKSIEDRMARWNARRGIIDAAGPEFSLVRAVRGLMSRHPEREAPFECEVSDAVSKNLEWASGSAGGLWIPEEFLGNEFIELLRAKSVTRQAGIRVLSGLTTAPVIIPRLGGGVSGGWIGQGDEISEEDVTTQQIDLTPHIAAARTTLSKLMGLMGSVAAVEPLLREDLSEAIATLIDIAVLRGSGSGDEPTGVANTSGINTLALSTGTGDTPSIDDLYDMEYKLLEDKVTGPFAWIMHPREFTTLRKVKDTNGQYLVQPDPTQASRGFLLGWPVHTTHNCRITLGGGTLGEFFLGKWSDVILGEWGTLRLDVTDQGADHWEHDEIGIKVVYYCDVDMRHPVSVCYCNDAAPE